MYNCMRRLLCFGLFFVFSTIWIQPSAWAKTPFVPEPPLHIYVNLWENKLYLMNGDQVMKTYRVAPGSSDTPTPVGDFVVTKRRSDGEAGSVPAGLRSTCRSASTGYTARTNRI